MDSLVFTVTDSAGHTAQVAQQVAVTPSAVDPIAVFTRKLDPLAPTIDPASNATVSALLAGIKASGAAFGVNSGGASDGSGWGTTFVDVTSATPRVKLTASGSHGDFTSQTGTSVPWVAGTVVQTGTGDGSVSIYNAGTDELWELWETVVNSDGSITATWGGYQAHASTSTGVFPYPYGVMASGLMLRALYVTQADIASGVITHTITFCAEQLAADNVPPANRWDDGTGTAGPHEGTWFRLPDGDPAPAGLTPLGAMVHQALIDYGAIVGDFGGAYQIGCEAGPVGGTDLVTVAMAGKPEYTAIANLDLSALVALAPPTAWPSWGVAEP